MQYMIKMMQNRRNYMQNHEKNTYSLCHIVITVLAVVLMGMIVWMMVIGARGELCRAGARVDAADGEAGNGG